MQFTYYSFFSLSTADFRNAFLKTIRQIIRESVRNMSIPATKPGQSSMNGTLTLPKPPPRDFSTSCKSSTSGRFFFLFKQTD